MHQFRSLVDANAQLVKWVLGTAGNRCHGTTYDKPLTRFTETERHMFKSLSTVPHELTAWAKVKVHGDCHVQYEKCRYSSRPDINNISTTVAAHPLPKYKTRFFCKCHH